MGLVNTIQRWLLTIIVFAIPFFFLPLTQEFFVTNKSYLILIGSLVSFILIGVHVFTTKKIHVVRGAFTRILLALLAIRVVTVYFATPNKEQALFSIPLGLSTFLGLTLLYFAIVHVSGVRREKLPVIQALVFGTLVSAIVTIVMFFNPLQSADLPPHLAFLKNQQFSTIGNILDTLLLLGFATIAIFSGVFSKIKQSIKTPPSHYIAGLVIALALGMASYLAFKNPEGGFSFVQLPPLNISWYAALETLKDPKTALIGVGINNFDSIFTLVKPVAYNASELWQVNFTLARSTLLHIWVESGLLGLITMLLLGIYGIREVHGLFQNKDIEAPMYAVLGLFVGLMLLFFPPSFIALTIMFIYLTALAQKSMDYEKDFIDEYNVKPFAVIYMGIPLITLILAGGVMYYARTAYASEYYFKKSINAIQLNQGQEVYENLQKAIELRPYVERYRSQFGQINLLLANNLARQEELSDQDRQAIAQFIQQAIAEGKALVALNPNRASSWNTLAVIYRNIINVAQGAEAWTVASYREAIRRDPNNPQLRLNLGGVYYAAQNYEQAAQLFSEAVSLKPDWANAHYNLSWALYQSGNIQQAVAVMNNVLQLIDPNSEDFSLAQENLAVFQEALDESATGSADVEPVQESDATQDPLTLPEEPEVVISPPIELPDDAGPDEAIDTAPTPANTNDQDSEEDIEATESAT